METDKPRDRELEGYAWVEFVEVKADRRLPLPEKVEDVLQNEPDVKLATPYINWGYDESNDSDWMVLSKYPLKKDGYTTISKSEIDRASKTTSYIRPKTDFLENFPILSDAFSRQGSEFVYIATEQMIDDNPSSWLVEKWRLLRILPNTDEDDDIDDILNGNPGLISNL
jgi:hypothetical protein